MVKTYILAPNWTTAPPPDGSIQLGHLLDDLTDLVPINRGKVVEIPNSHLNKVDIKGGFKTSRSKLVSGELGAFARVIGLVGVGAGAGIYYKKDNSDVLSCKTLETMTFDPTAEYIAESMDLPETKKYMQGCQYKEPLYMVTGLKIGRGGSLQSNNSSSRGVKLDGGLNPPGSPVQIGGEAAFSRETAEEESWETSTDFIAAFRVRKIWYDHGDVKNKAHNKNAVMQDGTPAQAGPSRTLRVEDDISLSDVFAEVELTMDRDVEDGEEVNFILPTDPA